MMRSALLLSLSLVSLLSGACAEMPSPTAPTPVPETAPVPPPPAAPVPAIYRLHGPTGDGCAPAASFDRSWILVVENAGDAGMDIRATVQPEVTADCAPAFSGDWTPMAGGRRLAPLESGEVRIALEHMACGRAKFRLWNGDTLLAETRVTTGRECYAPIRY